MLGSSPYCLLHSLFMLLDGEGYLDVRLVGGSSHFSGIVEVLYDVPNNQWGTVCADTWGQDDAEVACRALGYIDGGIKNKPDF